MSADVIRAGSQTHSPELKQRDALKQDFVRSSEGELNTGDANGVTPLMRAVCSGRVEETQELLDGGADVNARRVDGFTPLLLAAFHGHTEVVRVLLEHGADASATCRYSTSADMWANARGFFGIAENLREALNTKQPNAASDFMVETEEAANADEGSVTNVAVEMDVRVSANELFAPVLVTNNTAQVDEDVNQDPNEDGQSDIENDIENVDLAFWVAPEEDQGAVQTRFAEEELNNVRGFENEAELQNAVSDELCPERVTEQKELQTRFTEEVNTKSAAEELSLTETRCQEDLNAERAGQVQTDSQPPVPEEQNREIAAVNKTEPQTRAPEEPKLEMVAEAEPLTRVPQEFKNKERAAGTPVKRPRRVLDERWEPPVLVAVDSAPAFRPGEAFMSRMTSMRGIALMAVAAIIVCGVMTFAIIKVTGGIDAVEKPAVDAAVEKPAENAPVDKPVMSQDSNVAKAPAIAKSETPTASGINGLVESGAAGKTEPDASPATEVVHKESGSEGEASSIGSEVNQKNLADSSLGFTSEVPSRVTRRPVRRSSVNNRSPATSVAETARESEGERSRGAAANSDDSEAKANGEVRERTVKSDPSSSIEGSQTLSSGSGSSKPKSKVIQWP